MTLKRALLACAAFFCFAPLAEAQQFNQFLAFGDSTTDTGWFANAKLSPIPNPFDAGVAAAVAAGGNAHFTGPGLGNAQILAGFFGLTANPANTPGGTNYAIGGAFDNGGPGSLGPWTNIELLSFGLPPNPAIPSTVGQINSYLASVGGHANPSGLYLFSTGGNDVFIAEDLALPQAVKTAYFSAEAQTLATSVAALQNAGARYIIVANEYLPAVFFGNPTALADGTFLQTTTWNDLAAAGVKFIPADTASVIAAVVKNPAPFGITDTVNNACTVSSVTCTTATLVAPNALQTHLFLDGIHLTEAGQQIIADYYYNLLAAPSEISFLAESAVQTTFAMITGVQQQIDAAQRQRLNGWNGWVNGQLQYLQMNNSSNGLPSDPGIPVSGTMGIDYRWQNGWLAGAAVTGGSVSPTFSLGGGYTQNEVALSLYTGYREGPWWGDVIASAGGLGFSTNRLVPIGITIQPNDGSTNGWDLSLAGELGYDFHTGFLTQGPVAGFILQNVTVNGFTETGSFTSLSFGDQIRNSEVSALGYRASFDWGQWHPYAQVVWDHEFDPLDRLVTASLTTTSAPSYSLPAVVLGRDWATATVGTEVRLSPSWIALASFTAQVGQQNVTNYGGLLGLNYSFDPGPRSGMVYKN